MTEDAPEPRRFPVETMINVVNEEAERIRITQRSLIDGGIRTASDPGMIRKAEILEATVRLLDQIHLNLPKIMEVLRPSAPRKRKPRYGAQ